MPVHLPTLTTAESLEDLVAEATAFALLFRLLGLLLRLQTRLCLNAASLPGQVLAAHPLLAGKVGCASRELRRGAACLGRLELRGPFGIEVLGVLVTRSALLLLLTLSGGLRGSTGGTWFG